MARTTQTITISLPPEMLKELKEILQEENRTMSELVREALRRYASERRWQSLYRYAERKAIESGITTEEQVNELIHARRVGETQGQSGAGQ